MLNGIDERIIHLLKKDATQNSEALAKHLNVSSSTVRRRIKKLMQSGVLRISASVDPTKVGLHLAVVLALDIVHDKLNQAEKKLADETQVEWVSKTTGRFDLIAFARFSSVAHLSTFLSSNLSRIDGIRNSETFICFDF